MKSERASTVKGKQSATQRLKPKSLKLLIMKTETEEANPANQKGNNNRHTRQQKILTARLLRMLTSAFKAELIPSAMGYMILVATIYTYTLVPFPQPAPPQLPFKTPQIPSNRDHKALNRATLGGLGTGPQKSKPSFYQPGPPAPFRGALS